ncbi:MAG: type IX secretion system outer membrane channel protein PorV [Bacteroidales bacterium]
MYNMKGKYSVLFPSMLLLLLSLKYSDAQDLTPYELGGQLNVVHVAVPFLTVAPDSRAGAMGDAGIATLPDVYSMHWNPAKFAFIENDFGAAFSYTPWLRNLIDDINLAYLSGYMRIDNYQVVSGSLTYFSLGEIIFTNMAGEPDGQHTPNEFALDAAYARLFSDNFSGGLAFRYIRSDLTGGAYVQGMASKAAQSFAADVSIYYHNDLNVSDFPGQLALGMNISNIGNKITYSDNQNAQFIPINMGLGSSLMIDIDPYNSLAVAVDLNKLLVPTPPVYYQDMEDDDGNPVIRAGLNPDVSVPMGMLQSFYDAPGGFREELREIFYSVGMEYWYLNQFAIRGGYYHEHETKGNRKYFTTGIGLKLNVFALDIAYLVPVYRTNPLANTLRFSLAFDFEALRRSSPDEAL